MVTDVKDAMLPEWSMDGRWLYFSGSRDDSHKIFKAPEAGGRATPITRGGGFGPRTSPDGARIYYARDATIWSVAAGGGDEQRVEGLPTLQPGYDQAWALGPSGIYIINPTPKTPGIDFIAFGGTGITRVVNLAGRPLAWSSMAVSRDGRRLLYSQIDGATGDIMLVDGFR